MKCVNHPENEACGLCNHCAKNICAECRTTIGENSYCPECTRRRAQEKGAEHSPVLALILSFFIGGLGQIYNGQIGKGIAILLTSWLVIPWVIGLIDAYQTAVKIRSGEVVTKKRFGCLIGVVIGIFLFWIFIAVMALLAAIAIPVFMQKKIIARENYLQTRLRASAIAFESYAAQNNGRYPATDDELAACGNSWLVTEKGSHNGYRITTELSNTGYHIIAEPDECGLSGNKIFTLRTNALMTEENCFTEDGNDPS